MQVGIGFSRYPHDRSEYSLQSWGGMGPALCAPSWTSSSLFPSLHLLSDGHGTNLWEQGAELSRDDHVFHVSGEVQHVCLTLQMEQSGSEEACSQRLLTHPTQVKSVNITHLARDPVDAFESWYGYSHQEKVLGISLSDFVQRLAEGDTRDGTGG